jgi:hypothetical protein
MPYAGDVAHTGPYRGRVARRLVPPLDGRQAACGAIRVPFFGIPRRLGMDDGDIYVEVCVSFCKRKRVFGVLDRSVVVEVVGCLISR